MLHLALLRWRREAKPKEEVLCFSPKLRLRTLGFSGTEFGYKDSLKASFERWERGTVRVARRGSGFRLRLE